MQYNELEAEEAGSLRTASDIFRVFAALAFIGGVLTAISMLSTRGLVVRIETVVYLIAAIGGGLISLWATSVALAALARIQLQMRATHSIVMRLEAQLGEQNKIMLAMGKRLDYLARAEREKV